jgi:CHAD domain-containing protein
VRQRIKRMRSLLRVVEPAFGSIAIESRKALGTSARLLAGARDADVAAASARELAITARDGDAGLDRVADALDREAAKAHHETTPVAEVSARLAEVSRLLQALDPDLDGEALLESALAKAYRRGRKAMRRAEHSLSTPDLHRWRQQVKHLWHLIRVARRRLPTRQRRLAADLDRLAEILGRDHDHAVRAERLALSPSGDLSLMRQLGLIAERRRNLEAEAFALAAKLYKRRPRAFAKRLSIR